MSILGYSGFVDLNKPEFSVVKGKYHTWFVVRNDGSAVVATFSTEKGANALVRRLNRSGRVHLS